MRLLLVRHGRTAANVARQLDTAVPGHELDEVGHEQARALVDRLTHLSIEAIYVSDLTRTQQTAAPLAHALGLTPQIRGGLREIQAGQHEMSDDWSGYVATLLAWREDLEHRMPGGETGAEVLGRFDEVVAEAYAAAYRTVVMVTHGAVMGTWTVARSTNISIDFLHRVSRDNTVVIELDGAPEQGWRVLRWGDDVPDAADGDGAVFVG